VKIEVDDPDTENPTGRILLVEPTMRKTVVGKLTRNHKGIISIDNYIYFDQSVCTSGQLPDLRSCVRVVAVESRQEVYSWRAVSVAASKFEAYTDKSKEYGYGA
jgi:hypothetical protein